MNWFSTLRNLPPSCRAVSHQPLTPRYSRANQKLDYLISNGVYLGCRADPERRNVVLIAVWAPPSTGRRGGYYACFRIRLEEEKASWAILYCFYDGTDGSPSFKTEESAALFARTNGFEEP